ncbi:uncharacterized protein A4U43_C02F2640 [Asparagus officinalis]|uniref:RING-type E3 ubiquitin transferase n=1 Tax=Asparagus officinalis TaxID=4686 RepID=A0A5P1FFA4_ASPOF|nr:uncharacterized protein A4U43_C02F2640 [Asparagus officinalis]
MRNAELKVTESEERVYCTLQKMAEVRETSKAVQSAIIMDLARALGMNSANYSKLAEQIKLLRSDLLASSTVEERKILMSLEKIFDSWSMEPRISDKKLDVDFEEDAQIPPFRNFLCPLTKEVMKDPVTVCESSQTYERTAIKYWFDRCLEDGRDPTCPITGQVLNKLDLKPNIGLKGAIEEISEEYPEIRYKVRNAGIVGMVVRMLKDQSKRVGSQIRCKALMAMYSMAKDDESKLIMLEEGMTRLAIRSLTASLEKEREYALRLLLEFSYVEGYCRKIALEKGALVLLSSLAGNVEYPVLYNLAEEILANIEKVEDNVEYLAMAGRYQPLLTRLCRGTENVQMEMASLVGKMTLTNSAKDYIARKGGQILVNMLSSNLEGKASCLQALYNLSTLDDNATILVDLGVLPALTNILFATQEDGSSYLRQLAASTIANIVSNSGHWELSSADMEGNQMQSEFIIHRLTDLLSESSCTYQAAILHILCGIASSPQASDLAATHLRGVNAITIILPYIEHEEPSCRSHALRLACLLAKKLGQVILEELRTSNKLPLMKEKLLDSECPLAERSEIACILAELPLADVEVKEVLGMNLLQWAVSNIKEQLSTSSGKQSKFPRIMLQGLLGLLLHYTRSQDREIVKLVQDNNFMNIFLEQISNRSHERAKQLAALGLKYLSNSSTVIISTSDSESQPSHGFCIPFTLLCRKVPMAPTLCPLHSAVCKSDSSFCLLKGNAIKPLIDLMNDESTQVQIAAVEALSTLVSDAYSLKNASEELEQLGLFDAVISLFKAVRPGELQERVISMVDRLFRVEGIVQLYSTDQDLVRALVEALRLGNMKTKRHAQDVLTNLRQISGVGGKNSSNSRGKKPNR